MSYFVGILNRIRNIFLVGVMGHAMGVVGGSSYGLWWLGWEVTAWVVGVMVCSFVGLLVLYKWRKRWRGRERKRWGRIKIIIFKWNS